MAKEEASLQTVAAMQEGAHEVPNVEARGAAVLRCLDMGKFEGYLKRKFEVPDQPYAKEANRKFQEERWGRTMALKPFYTDVTNLWTPRVQRLHRCPAPSQPLPSRAKCQDEGCPVP